MITRNNNEIRIYFSSETSIGKQAYAYVNASEKKVLGVMSQKPKYQVAIGQKLQMVLI